MKSLPYDGMHRNIVIPLGLSLLGLWISGCARRIPLSPYTPPPIVFQKTPTTAELASLINRTDQIVRMQSNSATVQVLSQASLPRLNTNLALERPKRIRILASVPFLPGSGIDLGSNDDSYWMRIPEGLGHTVYSSSHLRTEQRFPTELLSVEPAWLIDALGLARIDTSIPHSEPTLRTEGLLEISSSAVVGGTLGQRILLIDAQTGTIRQQILVGGDGRTRAHSEASDFEYYPAGQYSLPHRVRMRLEVGNQPLEMQLEIGHWAINQFLTNDPNLFTMPEYAGDRRIDLSQPTTNNWRALTSTTGYAATISTRPLLRGQDRRH